MEQHDARQVFTPTTVARLTFVERKRINDRLRSALTTPGKQVVVFGRPGGGKTTLLENKVHQTYERHITSRCVESTTLEECLLDALDKLGSSPRRIPAPRWTPASLARLLGAAHSCWILEDFHKMQRAEKVKLAQLMNLFTDMSDEWPDVRIIATGAAGSAREILVCEPETWNRVADIEVGLMTDQELFQIIRTGENLLNIRFPESTAEAIVHYAGGIPSACHQLCLNMCLMEGILETQTHPRTLSEENLGEAVNLWLEVRGGSPLRRGAALGSP